MASEAGINPVHFGLLSYRDLVNHLEGYSRSERSKWKRARLTAYMVYATNAKEPKDIEDWMPLDGERKKEKGLITKKQYDKLKKAWPV